MTGSYTYNANAQIPAADAVTVTLNGETVPASEYTLTYENNTNAGQAVVTAQGRNNHGGTCRSEFTIAPIQLAITALTVENRKYNATQELKVQKLDLEGILDADRDRVQPKLESVVAMAESADAGVYSEVTLSGALEMEGEAKDNYVLPAAGTVVKGNALNGGNDVIIDYAIITYIGVQVRSKEYDGTTDAHVVGEEYIVDPYNIPSRYLPDFIMDVSFSSAEPGRVELCGTASLKDDPVGKNFVFKNGQKEIEIDTSYGTIEPRPVEVQWSTPHIFTWDGQIHSVSATITNLVGTDNVTPVCTGTSGTKVGNYTAQVTGLAGPDKDKYTVKPSLKTFCFWGIEAIDLSGAEMTLSQTEYIYDGTDHRPEVTVKLNGETLVEGEDYYLKFAYSTVNAGEPLISVCGYHHYKGLVQATYTIHRPR